MGPVFAIFVSQTTKLFLDAWTNIRRKLESLTYLESANWLKFRNFHQFKSKTNSVLREMVYFQSYLYCYTWATDPMFTLLPVQLRSWQRLRWAFKRWTAAACSSLVCSERGRERQRMIGQSERDAEKETEKEKERQRERERAPSSQWTHFPFKIKTPIKT